MDHAPSSEPVLEPVPVEPHATPARRWALVGALLGGVALVVAGLLLFTPRDRPVPPERAGEPRQPTVSQTRPAAAPESSGRATAAKPAASGARTAGASATAGAAGERALRVEIFTDREAWIRAFVDGRRAFERLVEAGASIALAAEGDVVVRIGDGGAVRLRVNGEHQGRAGRDGEVVTRRFTVSASPSTGATAVVSEPRGTTGRTSAGPVRVEIATLRPAWIRATVDGERAFERLVPEGRTIPLVAARSIELLIGDAGAVRLTLDGKDLGVAGRPGQVVSRRFHTGVPE